MCRLFLVTVACLAILFGITGLYMMPKLIQTKIEERIHLKIGTQNFERFTRVPIPIQVKFYFFNVSNSREVLAGLERPHFQEVGPFVFEQWRRRSIVDILDNSRKITFKEYKTYYSKWPLRAGNVSADWLRQEPRVRYLDEPGSAQPASGPQRAFMLNPYAHNLTVINMPLLTILNKLAELEEGSVKRLASKAMARLIREGREKILITRPANELLFDGYKVGLLEAAKDLISNTLGYNFESPLPANKFGFFHGKNGTWKRDLNGDLTIFTGRNGSMRDFMQIDAWNGLKALKTWPQHTEAGDRCNQVRGTDGSQFHPGVTRDQLLTIFSAMICTSFQVQYREDTSARDIPLLRFVPTAEMFAAPKKVPQNACYCTIKEPRGWRLAASGHSSDSSDSSAPAAGAPTATEPPAGRARITNARCYIDGLLDLSRCQMGAPVAASRPHFYGADPMLAQLAGLKPQKERHEFYMDIEPMTGLVMRAAARAQMNALVEEAALEVVEAPLVGHMTPMVAPIFWLEEAAEIDEKASLDFKRQLLSNVSKAERSFVCAILLGCLLAAALAAHYWYADCYRLEAKLAVKRAEARHKQARGAALAAGGSRSRSAAADRRRRRARPRSSAGPARPARRTLGEALQGARASNLAQMALVSSRKPLVDLELEAARDRDEPQMCKTVGAAIAVGAALGAADAGAARNQRRPRRSRRSIGQPGLLERGRDQDDQLSRRGLVDNDWCQADRATTTASSSAGGHDEPERQEPSTSDGLLAGGRRASSADLSLSSD